jgi:predicted transcriptional regulator
MTLDDGLVKAVDKLARKMHTTRSGLARRALRDILARANAKRLEAKHRRGYERKPVEAEEFGVWEDEQNWGDE